MRQGRDFNFRFSGSAFLDAPCNGYASFLSQRAINGTISLHSPRVALKNLASPVRDSESYGKLIDGLYFLAYEGSGSCKRLPTPVPDFAMDVKFLRTGIRHDLDHGDTGEVIKKRVRKGAVFEKFSGKKSPQECGPEDFLATQLRLLSECLGFLGKL